MDVLQFLIGSELPSQDNEIKEQRSERICRFRWRLSCISQAFASKQDRVSKARRDFRKKRLNEIHDCPGTRVIRLFDG